MRWRGSGSPRIFFSIGQHLALHSQQGFLFRPALNLSSATANVREMRGLDVTTFGPILWVP